MTFGSRFNMPLELSPAPAHNLEVIGFKVFLGTANRRDRPAICDFYARL